MLPDVYAGIDQTVNRVFSTPSAGLLALASALAVWEVSGIIRAAIGALDQIYETQEPRPWWIRFPVSIAIACVLTAAIVGALLLATAARTAVHGSWGIPFAVLRWVLAIVLSGSVPSARPLTNSRPLICF